MDKHGRVKDVVIKDNYRVDDATGMKVPCDSVTVWADKGLIDIIKNVPGVASAFDIGGGFDYTVFFDPRYDREFVKQEIEAIILCRK